MPQRRVTIASSIGLHARPASFFSRAATATGCSVSIGRPGQAQVNAYSLLMVMGLGLGHGDEVELSVDGPGSAAALDDLVALLETDLDAQAAS